MKKTLSKKFILKIIVSILFVWWVLHNQKFNFDNVVAGLSNYKLMSFIAILYLMQLFLASIRTRQLIQAEKNSSLKISNIFTVSWASLFLNCVSPSSLVGDIFRIKKLIEIDPTTTKDNFFYASIFSKIFSTLSLLILSTLASFYIVNRIPHIQDILVVSISVLVILTILFLFREKLLVLCKPLFLKFYYKISNNFFLNRLENFRVYYLKLTRQQNIWLTSLTCSLILQLLNSVTFILIIYTINPETDVSILELLSIVPLGIFIATLPISFSGIGVGHAAFATLLKIFHIDNGADVFTIFFSISFILDLIGSIFFVKLFKETFK